MKGKKIFYYFLFVVSCLSALNFKHNLTGIDLSDNSYGTWQLQRESKNDGYYWDLFFIDKNTGWVACDSGKIIHTTDSGLNWQEQHIPFKKLIHSISFINRNEGWVCGENYIYFTSDGGKNWSTQFIDTSKSKYGTLKGFLKIFFINENSGWVVNNSGELLSTNDGGYSWTIMETWEGYGPTHFSFINENYGYVLVPADYLLYTDNGGKKWEKISIAELKFSSGVDFINKRIGWIISMYGLSSTMESDSPVFHTSDGGKTWTQKSVIKDDLLSVEFADEKNGWIAGTRGIYITKNGGSNWSSSTINGFFVDVCVVDQQNVWALDFSGRIYKYIPN